MTIDALIMLAGALVASLPFLGFPNSWDNTILLIVGICVIALGIIVRRRIGQGTQSRSQRSGETTYSESLPPQTDTFSASSVHDTKKTVE